jgi:hypothetical protein
MKSATHRVQKMSDTIWVKKSRVSALARQRVIHPSRKQHACCDVATFLCASTLQNAKFEWE